MAPSRIPPRSACTPLLQAVSSRERD
jgi:hypothetical protein